MVERFNGRIEDVVQSHRLRSAQYLEHTILRYVQLYNGQLPQTVLKSRTPIGALKGWHRKKPELFKKDRTITRHVTSGDISTQQAHFAMEEISQ